MIQSRRNVFDQKVNVEQAGHAGLWLDKYLAYQLKRGEKADPEVGTPQSCLIKETAGMPIMAGYSMFFNRWKATLEDLGARCREAHTLGRMVIGLGDESVLETSVTLHRTYGVPYIPGSALKGLAAMFVRTRLAGTEWGECIGQRQAKQWVAGQPYNVVFGDTEQAGYVTFFDALYVPGSEHNGQALWPDVITVHHPDYYQGKDAPPADWDSPTPIPFLSATGNYLIALAAQPGCDAWVNLTFDLLGHALRELGIGAKTSSGYGRMLLDEPTPPPVDPHQQVVGDILKRIDELPDPRVTREINKFYQEAQRLALSDRLYHQVLQAISDRIERAGEHKRFAQKGWYQELVARLKDGR
jgi:CRISPR-associated protein Cmr6